MQAVQNDRQIELTNIGNARSTAVVLGAALLASFLLPMPGKDGRVLGMPSICPFYDFTGLPCPGCGLTRSFISFAHGHLMQALHWNLLGPALWLAFAAIFLRNLVSAVLGRTVLPLSRAFVSRASGLSLALFLLFGVARIAYLLIQHQKFQ